MTGKTNQEQAAELLLIQIKTAFPDAIFSGSITAVDGSQQEELDEELTLYTNLSGKRWSDIPHSFIENYPDGIVLLTAAAFAAFLPAWLTCAIAREKVREMTAYMFSSDDSGPSVFMGNLINQLSNSQKKALQSYLAYCADFESDPDIKERFRSAADHVKKLGNFGDTIPN